MQVFLSLQALMGQPTCQLFVLTQFGLLGYIYKCLTVCQPYLVLMFLLMPSFSSVELQIFGSCLMSGLEVVPVGQQLELPNVPALGQVFVRAALPLKANLPRSANGDVHVYLCQHQRTRLLLPRSPPAYQ